MLDKTRAKLKSYTDGDPQRCADGQFRKVDAETRIKPSEIEKLLSLYNEVKPDLSIETGMAYGFSTIPFLDANAQRKHGRHIAIDPDQITKWHGLALASIEDLGFSDFFHWISSTSDQAFVEMTRQAQHGQFFFFDGIHSFDGLMTDFFLANQILEVGGMLVFNQLWMPGGRAMLSYIHNNFDCYRLIPTGSDQLFAFRKVSQDSRLWDHFVAFDGSGKARDEPERSLWRKLLG